MRRRSFNVLLILILAWPAISSAKFNGVVGPSCLKSVFKGWFWDYNKPHNEMKSRKKIKVTNPFISTTSTTDVSTHDTSGYSTRLTSVLDPGVYSNFTTSSGQMTSSSGECKLTVGEAERFREVYIAENFDEVKKELALGSGEHLKVLAFFSLCDREEPFAVEMKSHFDNFVNLHTASEMSAKMSDVIHHSRALIGSCHS